MHDLHRNVHDMHQTCLYFHSRNRTFMMKNKYVDVRERAVMVGAVHLRRGFKLNHL